MAQKQVSHYSGEFGLLLRHDRTPVDDSLTYKIELKSLSRRINRLKSSEGYLYAGSPKFLGLFGRDSLIVSWQLLDYDPSIAKDTLTALAKIQGRRVNEATREEPGKIPHEYYPKGKTSEEWFEKYKARVTWLRIGRPEYLAVDTTPLFIILLAKYYDKTKDYDTLKRLWPNAKNALSWMLDFGFQDKFLRYEPKMDKLRSQSWKDGIGRLMDDAVSPVAVVEVQGYADMAFNDMAKLMRIMGDTILLDRTGKAERFLRRNFWQYFWMEDEQYYAMAIDGNGRKIRSISSNPGQLLFTGMLGKRESDMIVKRLFMGDMLTPYGIRTLSSKDPYFDQYAYQLGSIWPHDNWIIAEGLKRLGYIREYGMIKDRLIRAASELGSIPEYYCVSRDNRLIGLSETRTKPCDPQAWSLGALISMLNGK